ncbi:hypothetical protein F4679DRAFT_324561 [Xylaria curta]|nr:hypothetical protein F4679DRAFT_324561 [Xylaria curta]
MHVVTSFGSILLANCTFVEGKILCLVPCLPSINCGVGKVAGGVGDLAVGDVGNCVLGNARLRRVNEDGAGE